MDELNLHQVLDLFSPYPVAWMISRNGNTALAQHLFAHASQLHGIEPDTLVIHRHRGAPMITHSYRDFLEDCGVRRSYARPRMSNDNPFSESAFRTLKYSRGYPGRFNAIDHARSWMHGFIADSTHRPHEGLAFYTPADVLEGRTDAVHARRRDALHIYYAKHRGVFRRAFRSRSERRAGCASTPTTASPVRPASGSRMPVPVSARTHRSARRPLIGDPMAHCWIEVDTFRLQ